METKTVKGRGPQFLQTTVDNHQAAGWDVMSIDRGTLGSIIVTFTRTTLVPATPARPDVHIG
jgi:hypothetical protein